MCENSVTENDPAHLSIFVIMKGTNESTQVSTIHRKAQVKDFSSAQRSCRRLAMHSLACPNEELLRLLSAHSSSRVLLDTDWCRCAVRLHCEVSHRLSTIPT